MLLIMRMMRVSAECVGIDDDEDYENEKRKSQMRVIMRAAFVCIDDNEHDDN
jgi:hypothetical protein